MWHAHVSDKPQAAGLWSQRACLIPSMLRRGRIASTRNAWHIGKRRFMVAVCPSTTYLVQSRGQRPTLIPLSLGDA